MCSINENSDLKTRQQEARANLREDFLKAISELHGEPVRMITYESSALEATFSGWNPDGTEFFVKQLTTPARVVMPSALLRSPDILAIEFVRPLQLP